MIVYTDESYCDTAYGADMGWFKQGRAALYRRVVKGTRLIILHGMTRHGMLVRIDPQTGEVCLPDMYQSGEYLSGEMIFQGKEEGDYHLNMTGVGHAVNAAESPACVHAADRRPSSDGSITACSQPSATCSQVGMAEATASLTSLYRETVNPGT